MVTRTFEKFKKNAKINQSFNFLFYENMKILDFEVPVYQLKVTKDMCDQFGLFHKSAISSVMDGCTVMTLIGKMELDKDVVSVSMNTRYFHECEAGSIVNIYPKIMSFYNNLGIISANAVVDHKTIADVQHNVYVLSK